MTDEEHTICSSLFRTSTITYSSTEPLSSVRFFRSSLNKKDQSSFLHSSGGLPAGLRFGATGLASPLNAGASATQPPTSQPTGAARPPPSNDPNNYAGVFAQMLNMMSNQNIVCLVKILLLLRLTSLVFLD